MELTPASLLLRIKFCCFCRHDAGWHEAKTKTDYTLWNIHEGSLVLEINGKKMTASEGDVLLFHPGDSYTAFCGGDCCNFLVTFFTFDTGNCLDVFKQCNSAGIYSADAVREASRRFCGTYLDACQNTGAASLRLYALFLSFLAELFPYLGTQDCFYALPAKTPPRKINRLLAYIEENIEKNIPVKELASFMGMSEKYFIQFFHSHIGYSPKQYMTNRRMEYCLGLLSDGRLTVSEIAARLQFSDRYAFSKAFKKYYGEAPGAFRRHYITGHIP